MDTADCRQIEQAHQEWIAALDVVEYPIFMHDKEFRILRCNRAYQQYTGLSFNEIIGQPYYNLLPKTGAPLHHCLEALAYPESEAKEEEVQIEGTIFRSRSYSIRNDRNEYLYSLHTLEDITSKRNMERALRESEEKFRGLVESTSDWIWEVDTMGRYTYVSPRIEALLGFTPNEVIGKTPFDLMPPDEVARVADIFVPIIAQRAPILGMENANICKDGTQKILETSGVPFFNDKNEFAGYRGIDRDVTNRIMAETNLHASEERYRTLFETMLNGFAYCQILYDEGGNPVDFIYLMVNKAFEQQTGLTNVTGKRISDVIPGIHESNPEFLERYAKVAQGGKAEQFEIYLKSLEMWFFISVFSTQKDYFVAVFDVITERKKAEEALVNEVHRRQLLMENSHDGIAVVDDQFKIIETNARMATMLGYTPEEMLGLYVWDFEGTLDENAIRHNFADIVNINTTIETRHRRKDGSFYDAEVSISGLLIDDQAMTFTITRDITERKRSDASLYRANRALKTLSAGNMALVRTKTENELLQTVCDIIVEQAGYSLAAVVYADDNLGKTISFMAGAGMNNQDYDWVAQLTWSDTPQGQLPVSLAIRSKETQVCHNIACAIGFAPWKENTLSHGYASNIALPLFNDEETFGALCIYSTEENAFDTAEIELLEELTDDLAYGILNLRTRIAHEQQSTLLRQSLEESIQTIAATVEARDPYTAGHQRRVAELATAIAREMQLDEEQIRGIHFASIIHDLGKIHIPAEILSKPGRLNAIEFMLIQTHSQEGYNILKEVHFPWPIAETILQHHEKLDGSGYPNGLKGDQIRLEARIITVADIMEAMSSHRPYRAALGIEPALNEIERGKGIQYDPAVVDACSRLFIDKEFQFNYD